MATCENCGSEFESARATARFCKPACRVAYSRKPEGSQAKVQRDSNRKAGVPKVTAVILLEDEAAIKRVDERRGNLSRIDYLKALIMQQSSTGAILASRLPGETVGPARKVAAHQVRPEHFSVAAAARPEATLFDCCRHCKHGLRITGHTEKCTQGCHDE